MRPYMVVTARYPAFLTSASFLSPWVGVCDFCWTISLRGVLLMPSSARLRLETFGDVKPRWSFGNQEPVLPSSS